jgi:hypothetical protein
MNSRFPAEPPQRRRSHPLNTARSAFRNGDNEIRLTLPVTPHVVGGSGLTIHPAVAIALGVSPGQRRHFKNSPHGKSA